MRKFMSLLAIAIAILAISISSYATYTLGEGSYSVPEIIPAGDYIIKDSSFSTDFSLTRDGVVILSTNLQNNEVPLPLSDGDVLNVTQGEVFIYNEDMFKGYEYIEAGDYYAPDDIPSGKYEFVSLGGSWAGVGIMDPSVKDEDGEDSCLEAVLVGAGDKHIFRIKDGQYVTITRPGYMKKCFKLFG